MMTNYKYDNFFVHRRRRRHHRHHNFTTIIKIKYKNPFSSLKIHFEILTSF